MAKRKKRNRGGGVPFNPDVDTGTKRPVTARVAVGDVNDKFSDYPSNGLTPRRLARIFREADEGNVRAQMELFEEMEEKDTHLFSQMQTRKLAVTGLDWEVQPFSEDEIDKEIADFIDEQLKGIENFDEVLIDMLDAIGKGISIMELAWTVEDGRNVIEDIEYVHPKKLVWDSTTDELKVCTREYPSGVELPENKFVVHKYKEVVEIYKTLACDMGLEIPKSHIYKKFNIPKPENGEEVLKPPQAGMMTAQQQPMETTEELKLKQEEGQAEQRQVDTIVSIANKQSEDIFREMMKPIFKMIDKAEDMDELQKVLKDEKKLRELYQDMESPELEDLIQQGIYLSHLIGRSMD